ncbi:MAG: hypothetical protein R2838_18050 [Caldilineaceae bacterium]
MSTISHAYPGPDDIHVFLGQQARLYVQPNPAARRGHGGPPGHRSGP